MIIEPFHVNSHGKRWRFVDSQAISSELERTRIQQIAQLQLATMQDDAKCVALGIAESGTIGNLFFGVYDPGGSLAGIFFLAALEYQSGPWEDLVDWSVTSADPAIFHARPMPGFPALTLEDSLELSVDGAHHLLKHRTETVDGFQVEFRRFSWAIYQARTDPNSRAMQRIHDRAASDGRFTMTELPDPADPTRTRVDIEIA
jgi:hypothetical protein